MKLKLFFFCLTSLYLCRADQFNQNVTLQSYGSVMYIGSDILQKQKVFSVYFPQVSYQISYDLLFKEGTMDKELYKYRQSYDNSSNQQYCFLYPTDIQISDMSEKQLETTPLLAYGYESNKNGRIYFVGKNRKMYLYGYDSMNVWRLRTINIPDSMIKFENEQISGVVKMVHFNSRLFVFSFESVYFLKDHPDQSEFKKMNNYEGGVIDMGIFNANKSQIWVLDKTGIVIYKYSVDSYDLEIVQRYAGFGQNFIRSVEMRRQNNSAIFYLLSDHELIKFTAFDNNQTANTTYSLEGQCNKLRIIDDNLYIMCRFEKVNFITELKMEENNLTLNQYYDDKTVEGIRDVIKFGKQKILLIGDNEGEVTGKAINRVVLLDLAEQRKVQRKDFFYIPKNILQILNIENQATYHQSGLLLVEKNKLKVVRVTQNPPQLRCLVRQSDKISQFLVTAVFNSTLCPIDLSENIPLTKNSFCQIWYPFEITVGAREVEKGKADIAIFGIVLFLFILTVVCFGWCFTFRKNIKQLREKIVLKMEKMKQERKNKEKIEQKEQDDTFQQL